MAISTEPSAEQAAAGQRSLLLLRLAALVALRAHARERRFELLVVPPDSSAPGGLALRLPHALSALRVLCVHAPQQIDRGGDAQNKNSFQFLERLPPGWRPRGQENARYATFHVQGEDGVDVDTLDDFFFTDAGGCNVIPEYIQWKPENLSRWYNAILRFQRDAVQVIECIRAQIDGLFGSPLPISQKIVEKYMEILKSRLKVQEKDCVISSGSVQEAVGAAVASALRDLATAALGDVLVFEEDACADLRAALSGADPLRVVVPGVSPPLRAAKLIQILRQDYPDEWLYLNQIIWETFPKKALLAACRTCRLVLVDKEGTGDWIESLMKQGQNGVTLILLTSGEADDTWGKTRFIEDTWKITDLVETSQKEMLNSFLQLKLRQPEEAWRRLRVEANGAQPITAASAQPITVASAPPGRAMLSHLPARRRAADSTRTSSESSPERNHVDDAQDARGREPVQAPARPPVALRRVKGSAKPWSFEYEYKLPGLVALRARRAGLRFQIYSNAYAARPFDDVVLRVLEPTPALYFVQLKHGQNSKRIKEEEFTTDQGHYDLKKHFHYFKKFRDKHEDRKSIKDKGERFLTSGRFEDTRFLFYTTRTREQAAPGRTDDEDFRHEDLFRTGGDSYCFGREDEQIWNLKEGHPSNDIYQHEFLKRLRFMSGQSCSDSLDDLIRNEIQGIFGGDLPQADKFLIQYMSFLRTWALDENNGSCISDTSPELQIESFLAEELRAEAREAAGAPLAFRESACADLRAAVRSSGDALRVAVPGVPPGLRAAKLLQALDRERPQQWALLSNAALKKYTRAALAAACSACRVVVWDVDRAPAGARELRLQLQGRGTCVELHSGAGRAGDALDEWALDQLADEAQEHFLDCPLLFQGAAVRLRDLEGAWPRLRADVDGALLGALARGDAALGAAPPPPLAHEQLPTTLLHCSALRPSALRLQAAGEHLALSGFSLQALRGLHAQCGVDGDARANSRWTVLRLDNEDAAGDEEAFARVCRERGACNVHWVECVDGVEGAVEGAGAGALAWRRSRGRPGALAEHVLPAGARCARTPECEHAREAAADAAAWGGGAALLAGEAGAGKSSFLRRAAAAARALRPARWALLVEALAHRRLLRRWPEPSEMKLRHVMELLAEAAGVAAPEAAAGRRCLEAALRQGGGVQVYVDGVDEVCPFFEGKILRALQLLRGTDVSLWVSCRPEVQLSLQRVLRCWPVTLKPLSRAAQKELLRLLWKRATAHEHTLAPLNFERVADELVQLLADTVPDTSPEGGLLQVPLHVHMAAEVFEEAAVEATRTGSSLLGQNPVSLFNLYSKFVHLKRDLCWDKHGLKEATLDRTPFNDVFLQAHQECAMFTLLSDGSYEGVDATEFRDCMRQHASFIRREKTGIMWMQEDGGLRFAHFSFVEFFAAAWLRAHAATSRTAAAVVRSLFARAPGARLRLFLELALAEGRPLHQALLAGAEAQAEADAVDAVDGGGRLALHLAAALGLERSVRQLLKGGCAPGASDRLLQWTPLQYVDAVLPHLAADKVQWLRVAERLLEAGANPKQLTAKVNTDDLFPDIFSELPKVAMQLQKLGVKIQPPRLPSQPANIPEGLSVILIGFRWKKRSPTETSQLLAKIHENGVAVNFNVDDIEIAVMHNNLNGHDGDIQINQAISFGNETAVTVLIVNRSNPDINKGVLRMNMDVMISKEDYKSKVLNLVPNIDRIDSVRLLRKGTPPNEGVFNCKRGSMEKLFKWIDTLLRTKKYKYINPTDKKTYSTPLQRSSRSLVERVEAVRFPQINLKIPGMNDKLIS